MSVPLAAEPGAGASPQPTFTSNSLSLTDAHPLPTPLTDAHPQVPASLADAHPLPLPALTPGVKITPWRSLNTVLMLGVGIYKATASYLGQSIAPTTVELIMGVGWTIICYWVSFTEQENSTWIFAYDLSGILRVAVIVFFIWFLVALVGAIAMTGLIIACKAMSEVVSESTAKVLALCSIGVFPFSLASTRVRQAVFSAFGLVMFASMIVWLPLWVPCMMALDDCNKKLEEQLELRGLPGWLVVFIQKTIIIGSGIMTYIGFYIALWVVAYMLMRLACNIICHLSDILLLAWPRAASCSATIPVHGRARSAASRCTTPSTPHPPPPYTVTRALATVRVRRAARGVGVDIEVA
ncbi:hypothetical protein FB451DRAFT_1371311 [Mycena latifolia]|nr:hypothetical protein FB451DRAFT_1371311 [Mycena latifolia]